MPHKHGNSFGNPGDKLTKNNRLVRQLLANGRGVNNGSRWGGIAHVANQGLAGLLMGMDASDKSAAQKVLMEALNPEATFDPVSGEEDMRGMTRLQAALTMDPNNEYMQRHGTQFAMQDMAARHAAEEQQKLWNRQDARQDTRWQHQDARQDKRWSLEDTRRGEDRTNELTDATTAFGRQQ